MLQSSPVLSVDSSFIEFTVECVNGDRLGRLTVPLSQMADWLNFLIAPQYAIDIISAEQRADFINVYFQANEGLYLYLDMKINSSVLTNS